jgi:hypothetical protein
MTMEEGAGATAIAFGLDRARGTPKLEEKVPRHEHRGQDAPYQGNGSRTKTCPETEKNSPASVLLQKKIKFDRGQINFKKNLNLIGVEFDNFKKF